jgi:hypothetical protein
MVSPAHEWTQVLSFMNMVPLVCSYLGGNMRRARQVG